MGCTLLRGYDTQNQRPDINGPASTARAWWVGLGGSALVDAMRAKPTHAVTPNSDDRPEGDPTVHLDAKMRSVTPPTLRSPARARPLPLARRHHRRQPSLPLPP